MLCRVGKVVDAAVPLIEPEQNDVFWWITLENAVDHVDHIAETPKFHAILWLENQDNDGSSWELI